MVRLNGLTKAAKLASGRSQRCSFCILRKERKCNAEVIRVCRDSFVEGYKKGAHFESDRNKAYVEMFSNSFGTDLSKRLKKMEEESKELIQAILEYESGLNGIEAVKDEMSDVLAVITHVSGLLNTNTRNLFLQAVDKIEKRKEDPNYKRNRPHVEYKRKEV